MSSIKMIAERIERFRSAWSEIASEASFGGMTLAEFEAAVSPSLTLREEILDLESRIEAKRVERDNADVGTSELLERVVDSVKGTPGFGPNSALYNAFGYIRKRERKTGLTRKRKRSTEPTSDDPPPAADAA